MAVDPKEGHADCLATLLCVVSCVLTGSPRSPAQPTIMSPIPWSSIHPHNELKFAAHPSRRSTIYGTKGVVASSQPLATAAGLEILNLGGNAADAAVATAAALNVTEPSCTGIGGDVFCLFFDAKDKEVKAVNGSGRSPEKLTLDYARSKGISGRSIPLTGQFLPSSDLSR